MYGDRVFSHTDTSGKKVIVTVSSRNKLMTLMHQHSSRDLRFVFFISRTLRKPCTLTEDARGNSRFGGQIPALHEKRPMFISI